MVSKMGTPTKGINMQAIVVIGPAGKNYNPQNGQQANKTTWAFIQAQIAKGPQTVQQLITQCAQQHNHGSYPGYLLRNNRLALKK